MATKKKKTAVELASEADPRAPLDGALLLSKAQGLLGELEGDLLLRSRNSIAVREAIRVRHEAERATRRTADPFEVWERQFVTQVAASWLLSCVFVRTLEDRGLLGLNRIAGPGAADSQRLFFELAPSLTEREYLLSVFRELTRLPAARELFDARHNPVWLLAPSADVAKKLLALFRAPNADAPGFRFGQGDTRFLGDLYQDLSSDVRERFALLQTPRFIETYILNRTLERAIARFGLDETTIIDPTCGSGHFLLGAFDRLVEHRLRKEPGLDVREAARKGLDAVYGADINPYAVAIARFRLTLAFLERGGYVHLVDAPSLPIHLVVADSLLHNPQHTQANLGELTGQTMKFWGGDEFALEDEAAAHDVLYRRFAAVTGNPPYITVKDSVLRERYKELYSTCFREFTLATPFTERFFQLARAGGFIGLITENGFMKRERGKRLIESYLRTVNLDGVVNTSGAYIPAHGTPTVLLFGTNEAKQGDNVLTVLAKRGEPSTPSDPEEGFVWRSIADHGSEVGFENDYVSVALVPRTTLEKHPWSLGGGGAADLKELLESRAEHRLADLVELIGFGAVTREDELFELPLDAGRRLGVEAVAAYGHGEAIRDWSFDHTADIAFPYCSDGTLSPAHLGRWMEWAWRLRTQLWLRQGKGFKTKKESGGEYYEYSMFYPQRHFAPLKIAFAFVATHNHFVLDRGGTVFNRSAPIIKLKEGSTEEDHLVLLAYLNSSTACFWMKQVCHNKTNASQKHTTDPARAAYEFAGTAIESLPVPKLDRAFVLPLAVALSEAASIRTEWVTGRLLRSQHGAWTSVDSLRDAIARGWQSYDDATVRAVCLQEELDWAIYHAFGLTTATVSSNIMLKEWICALGQRPFEAAAGYVDGVSERARTSVSPQRTVVNKLPDWWIGREAHGSQAPLALLETRECKRMWRDTEQNIDQQEFRRDAVHSWCEGVALDTLEASTKEGLELWKLRDATGSIRGTDSVLSIVAEFLGEDAAGLGHRLVLYEAVPFLAAHRFTDSGLEKRGEWERVWDLQRAEDRGEEVPAVDPPPRYDQKDYRDAMCWRLRGKLDIPKERFISYPGCESDEDKEPVFGWAGWNHLQQAQALAALYQKRKTEESWAQDRLSPMLAGLLELVPWVKQWHNEPSEDYGGLRLGDYFETFLDGECHALGLTREALRAWRPPEKRKKAKATVEPKDGEPGPKPRGRRKKVAPKTAET
jgi:hypothetical protein